MVFRIVFFLSVFAFTNPRPTNQEYLIYLLFFFIVCLKQNLPLILAFVSKARQTLAYKFITSVFQKASMVWNFFALYSLLKKN
jgi:hypothetical protein